MSEIRNYISESGDQELTLFPAEFLQGDLIKHEGEHVKAEGVYQPIAAASTDILIWAVDQKGTSVFFWRNATGEYLVRRKWEKP